MTHLPISIDAPFTLTVAATCGAAAMLIAVARKTILPKLSLALLAAGVVCLILAAGKLNWETSPPRTIAVMIDLSASTRTATFHDRPSLTKRLDQLLDGTPYTLYAFAEQREPADLAHLPPELPGDRTIFDPPPADAIVLFSDARFSLPKSAPPTYVIVDPALDHVSDGAITSLRSRGRELTVAVNNTAEAPRPITFSDAVPTTSSAPTGDTILSATLSPNATSATATLSAADPWRENDSLTINVPPPATLERWWIANTSAAIAPPGWRVLTQSALSADNAGYLHVGVIALNNIPADQISRFNRERIEQYVRDLGGGLLILGGDHAFAAGGYAGTSLERLSPLASNPPTPATRWILLVDSSGSMSASIGDNSRWNFAVDALLKLLPLLPPKDTITIGDFARDVRWWTTNTPADQLDWTHLVPKDIRPTGPTNLAPVLEQLAKSSDGDAPTQAIFITDAEATVDNADTLAAALAKNHIHVNILSLSPLPATSPLAHIVQQTGGVDLAEADPRQWSTGLRNLLRSTAPPWLNTKTFTIHFTAASAHLPAQDAAPWNHTWLKPNATELATGRDENGQSTPAVAGWNIGNGAVVATAFTPTPAIADALSEIVVTPPHDPRFNVTWDTGPEFRVTLDAVDGQKYLNNLKPTLVLTTESSTPETHSIPQVSPGRYSLSIPSPSHRGMARLTLDNRTLDRIAVADHYAPEFNAIGNDHQAMRTLATQTGGDVIEPDQVKPIEFPRQATSPIRLTTIFSVLGAALIASALIRWRLH